MQLVFGSCLTQLVLILLAQQRCQTASCYGFYAASDEATSAAR